MVRVGSFDFPDQLYFHREHMYVKIEGDKVQVGYDSWAQNAAGKVLFLRTRTTGSKVDQGKTLGTLESGKWVGPLKAPLSGTIITINDQVSKRPSLINEDPYGKGWIVMMQPTRLSEELPGLIPGTDKAKLETWISEEREKYGIKGE